MRTRNQSKRLKEEATGAGDSESSYGGLNHGEEGSLAAISKEAVGKLLKRVTYKKASGKKAGKESCPSSSESKDMVLELPRENCKRNEEHIQNFGVRDAEVGLSSKHGGAKGSADCDANELDWEEGTVLVSNFGEGYSHDLGREVTIEFTESPSSTQRKPSRRASAEEKELAELVHKVHLLCLLGRGRLIDSACNDPLIQASLLSLLPSYLSKIVEVSQLKASMLGSLVNWFNNNFHIQNESTNKGSFKSSLAVALETRKGTAEEVAALSVALFRSLGLRTRFMSILDVVSLKPDADMCGTSNQDTPRLDTRIFSGTTGVSPNQLCDPYNVHSSGTTGEDITHETPQRGKLHKGKNNETCRKNLVKDFADMGHSDDRTSQASASKTCPPTSDSCAPKSAEGSKRKGDLEFELQLQMALSATAGGVNDSKLGSDMDKLRTSSVPPATPLKKMRKTRNGNSPILAQGSSGAVWSRKAGPPLYWAEVYCSGETDGRWVHIDATNGIVDGEQKVEAAAAACRRPLKYVVAFAGNGAKDVTRRYCMQWHKIASQRINSQWWETVLAPLKELESGEIRGMVHAENASDLEKNYLEVSQPLGADFNNPADTSSQECSLGIESSKHVGKATVVEPNSSSRVSLEDMEMEIRALTEPLPTNQLAYKNHHLYAMERWLTKRQILHPKGPVLGYCSGHPVYPRSCVQTLQTKQKWLREGFQVRADEVPAKVVKRSKRPGNAQIFEPSGSEEDGEMTVELYGKWQLELLQLPHAVNGIVPKNEYGRVDVWSEKCLPPGTVHLRLPRLVAVARRLEIDYAPAMVGFEFRNGRSYPVFEGIVVCTEFRDAIMQAYEEEEERREEEEKKRNEAQALSRWYQLLSSIVTRQRLENSYVDSPALHTPPETLNDQKKDRSISQNNISETGEFSRGVSKGFVQDFRSVLPTADNHEHVFPIDHQSFDEESMIRTKRCPCGFSIQVEEL